jgi:hypothetical protein
LPITRNDDGNTTLDTAVPEKAPAPISVTPSGIVAEPTHAVLPVTTCDATVNVPLVPQAIVPSETALAVGAQTKVDATTIDDAKKVKPRLRWLISESYH